MKGGEEFLRDTDGKGTLPPLSYSLHGNQGLAQSNGVGVGEKIGWEPGPGSLAFLGAASVL